MNTTQLLRHLKSILDRRRVLISFRALPNEIVACSDCSEDYQEINITLDPLWAAPIPSVLHELLHIYFQEKGIRRMVDKLLEEGLVTKLERKLVNRLSEPSQQIFARDLETSFKKCLGEETMAYGSPTKPRKPRKPKPKKGR